MNVTKESFSGKINDKSLKKLKMLNNPKAVNLVEEYAKLCRPEKITVLSDSKEDLEYIKQLSLKNGEERKLGTEGHTIHFDGYYDQGRDGKNTKVLLPKGVKISKYIHTGEREECVKEALQLLDGIMEGKEMLVCFFCLGPLNSRFSISAMQITDSAYVAHSESILYRQGYADDWAAQPPLPQVPGPAWLFRQ